jgi:signal transduction histidine kinase
MALAYCTPALQQMDDRLHELCQPMTALQVRLEIGLALGDEAALREAVHAALDEVRRVFAATQQAKAALLQLEQEMSAVIVPLVR